MVESFAPVGKIFQSTALRRNENASFIRRFRIGIAIAFTWGAEE
jgi:hypothetical protein